MNFYAECPPCPICPHIAHHDVEQLARHLSIRHLLKNSGSILARIMMNSQLGHSEAVAVLKDVRNLNEKFEDCAKFSRARELENSEQELKMIQTETNANLEIEELKKIIEAKNITVGMLESQLSEAQAKIKKCKKESHNFEEGEEHTFELMTVMEELTAVKDEKIKKDEEVEYWKLLALEHEAKVKSVVSEMKEQESALKAINYKLGMDKKNEKIISAQLIESQKLVHEKEIQDFNQKLQSQINRSQVLKTRDKSLVEEVESLRADSWRKKDHAESLSNQVNSLKDEMQVSEKNIDKKNAEIYQLKEKLVTLESTVEKLNKDIEDLNDHLLKKCKENLNIKHCFENYKEVSKDTITEKDKMLAFLEKELENTKDEYVEEFEKYSKKMFYEMTIADMKLKVGQYQETMCIMKDSLASLTTMHEDTSEALRNVKKQFHGLDNDISRFCHVPVLVENNLEVNNKVAVVKKEPKDIFSLGQGTSYNYGGLGAQDRPLKFTVEGDEGKESLKTSNGSDEESEKNERIRSNKRKFTE